MSKPRAPQIPRITSFPPFYFLFVSLVSFIRHWITARRVRDCLLFVTIRFHYNAKQLLKFMLAAIASLPAATMSTSNKIPPNIPLASTLRNSSLRAQRSLQLRLRSEALRKFVSLSTLSLCLVTRKFVEFSRDFSTSVSFFSKRVSFFFFSTRISVATRRRRNISPMLGCHGVTIRRERSTLVAHFLAFKWLGI